MSQKQDAKSKTNTKTKIIAISAVLIVGLFSIISVTMQNNANIEFHNFNSLQELETYSSSLSQSDINNSIFAVNNVVYENIGGKWMATSRTVNTYGGVSIGKDGKDGKDGVSAYSLAAESGFTGSEDEFIDVLLDFAQNNTDDAYTLFVQNGYSGTKAEFEDIINSLNGKDGIDGKDGVDGTDGKDGRDGIDGEDGRNGVDGTDGTDGIDGQDGVDGKDGKNGVNGRNGRNGINGINGINGKDGVDGKSAYEIFVSQGFAGTETDFINTLFAAAATEGSDNVTTVLSNYGFTGNASDVETALTGEQGDKGAKGDKGETGDPGLDGISQVMNVSGTEFSLTNGYWNIDNTQTSELARAKEISIEGGYFYVEDSQKGEATVNNADVSASTDAISISYEKNGLAEEVLNVSEIQDIPTALSSNGSVITYSKDGQETTMFDINNYVPQCNSTDLSITDANGNPMTSMVAHDIIIGDNGNFWKYNYSTQAYEDTGTQAAGIDGANGQNGVSVGTIYATEAEIPERLKPYCIQPFSEVSAAEVNYYSSTGTLYYVEDFSWQEYSSDRTTEDAHSSSFYYSSTPVSYKYESHPSVPDSNGGTWYQYEIEGKTCTQVTISDYYYSYYDPEKGRQMTYSYATDYGAERPKRISYENYGKSTQTSSVDYTLPRYSGNPSQRFDIQVTDYKYNGTTLTTEQLQKLYNAGIISDYTVNDKAHTKELYTYAGNAWVYCGKTS